MNPFHRKEAVYCNQFFSESLPSALNIKATRTDRIIELVRADRNHPENGRMLGSRKNQDPDDWHSRRDFSWVQKWENAANNFAKSSRPIHEFEPLLESNLEALEHLLFYVFKVSELLQRVTSHFWGGPSISTMNSFTNPACPGIFVADVVCKGLRFVSAGFGP
jgi:hypothetical protein